MKTDLLNNVVPEQVAKQRTMENCTGIWQAAMEKSTSNTDQNNEINPVLPPQNMHSKDVHGAECRSPIAEWIDMATDKEGTWGREIEVTQL